MTKHFDIHSGAPIALSCTKRAVHRHAWTVDVRNGNYSAFNGYHFTPSEYSQVRCPLCPKVWRTKAAYVAELPDTPREAR